MSIPVSVDYTDEYEKQRYELMSNSIAAYTSKDPLTIVNEYLKGPKLYHNNVIDPSKSWFIAISMKEGNIGKNDPDVKYRSLGDPAVFSIDSNKVYIIEKVIGNMQYYLIINPDDENDYYMNKAGVITQTNETHPRTYLQKLYNRVNVFNCYSISVSSITRDFAAKKWMNMITGHGYRDYPMVSLQYDGEVKYDTAYHLHDSNLSFYISEYWEQRKKRYDCDLNPRCNCNACRNEDHSWCKTFFDQPCSMEYN